MKTEIICVIENDRQAVRYEVKIEIIDPHRLGERMLYIVLPKTATVRAGMEVIRGDGSRWIIRNCYGDPDTGYKRAICELLQTPIIKS